MAKDFYAYLPVLVTRFYEGIAEDSDGLESILNGFLRSMSDAELDVLIDEIDRLLARSKTDEELLQEVWKLGARDIPGGNVRASLSRIRSEAARRHRNV